MNSQNNKARQLVKNTQLDAIQLATIDNQTLKNYHESWVINKMYEDRKMGGFQLPYVENMFYQGYISDYFMQKVKIENKSIYYIHFWITVNIPDVGVGELEYKINANYTPNSDFCKLIFNLGMNPLNTFEVQLDNLINLPVWARLKKNGNFIEVAELEKRQI